MNNKVTAYGFEFGAAVVERRADLGDGRVVVSITTPKGVLDVYVAKTGKMRVYLDHKELVERASGGHHADDSGISGSK